METYRVKKIHCLVCDSFIEADFEKDIRIAKCDCSNKTLLDNRFSFSIPNSTISAKDKTKLKGQFLEDKKDWGKKGDWFYIREPENEKTQKHTQWIGQTLSGNVVIFETQLMTPNSCRQLLKSKMVIHEKTGEQIYHFWRQVSSEDIIKLNEMKLATNR